MTPSRCSLCGSERISLRRSDGGPHFGKYVCPAGHFNGWAPHPPVSADEVPDGVLVLAVPRDRPVTLRGTPAQVAAARSVRYQLLTVAERVGLADLLAVMKCVNDATWFLANKGRTLPDLKCWPRADQMEPARTGVGNE